MIIPRENSSNAFGGAPWRWAAGISVVCLVPLILMGFGVDFSSDRSALSPEMVVGLSTAELGDTIHHALRGSFTHTLLEWTAVCAAAFVGILTFVQFRLTRESSLPIIGMALVCAGTMDAFHTFCADRLIEAVADNRSMIPFTWALCRLFNGIIMLLGVGLFAFSGKRKFLDKGNRVIIGASAGFIAAAYFIVHFCATSQALPQTMFPDAAIKRPFDIYPLIPYLLCGLLVYPLYFKRYRTTFACALMLSVIPNIATQLYMAFGSLKLHDSCFNIAHALKALSYGVPMIGLLTEYMRTFKERARADELLRDTHSELEMREACTRAIVDTAADGIITIDEKGTVQSMNKAALEMFGYSESEAIGGNVSLLMPSPVREEHDTYLQRYLETGVETVLRRRCEVIARRKDGSTFSACLGVSVALVGSRRIFTGILRDVTERMAAEAELEAVNKRLMIASRRAGMAEVATGVLHNVGNVLNSVNVSATLVSDKLQGSKSASLAKAVGLMSEHSHDLGRFLTEDERGRRLPAYLDKLVDHLAAEQHFMMEELESLTTNIDDIKRIVGTQESDAGAYGVVETASIAEIVDDALTVSDASSERYGIEIVRDYADLPPVCLDKHKLLQIMVNLVRNAKHAVLDGESDEKRLTLRIARNNSARVRIEVTDTGVGIRKENLARIFSQSFTPRKDGGAFGLHSAALVAKDMGGSLSVRSGGPGKGATFTLELPLEAAEVTV